MMASNNGKKCRIQKTPKMLKDFLTIPSNYDPTIQVLLDQAILPRSRSRSRSHAAFTSFHKLLNSAFKSLHRFTTSSSPTLLSRSLSKSVLNKFSFTLKNKLKSKSKSKSSCSEGVASSKVKVKDILRWRSFRNVVVEDPIKPLDSLLLHEYDNVVFQNDDASIWDDLNMSATTTAITTNMDSSNNDFESELKSNSSKLSCGESEFCFTMDELPCWWGNLIQAAKLWDRNNDVVATVCDIVGSKEDNQSIPIGDEKEQHSPVSVLDSPFGNEICDQELESSFDQSFANIERTKQSLLQSIQWLESLAGVSDNEDDETIDLLQEVEQEDNTVRAKMKGNKSRAIVKLVIREGQCFKDKKVCIKDMEIQGQWSKFEDEKEELGLELEVLLFNDLVNEVLVDL